MIILIADTLLGYHSEEGWTGLIELVRAGPDARLHSSITQLLSPAAQSMSLADGSLQACLGYSAYQCCL